MYVSINSSIPLLHLQILDSLDVQLKSLGQISGIDRWLRRKNSVGDESKAWTLAIERRRHNTVSSRHVSHVVNQPRREDKNIAFLENFAVIFVLRVRGYEPHLHRARHHIHQLRRPRVDVRWGEPTWRKIYARKQHPESVEPWHGVHGSDVGGDAIGFGGIARNIQTAEIKVVRGYCFWVLACCCKTKIYY